MNERMTWTKAWRRTVATAIQAVFAFALVIAGLWLSGELVAEEVKVAAITAFVVPVITAAHRLAEAWRQQEYDEPPAG